MKSLFQLITFLWYIIHLFNVDSCSTTDRVMNCTNMNLTDCPSVNKSVDSLILDENLLDNIATKSCQSWTHLKNLSVRHNKLKSVNTTKILKLLQRLDLSHNLLSSINIEAELLTFINISHNLLTDEIIFKMNILKQLIISNNNLDNKLFGKVVEYVHNSHSISLLDVSCNNIDSISQYIMTLTSNSILSINFTRNKLSNISFSSFKKSKNAINFDFSFNKIIDFSITDEFNILKLNFSNNRLTKIDANKLTKFVNLQKIDLSNNPLNCDCSESASFVQWMIKHKQIVSNKNQTICSNPPKVPVLNMSCVPITSSTNQPIITSARHTLYPITNHVPIENKSWKIAVGFLVVSLIVILILTIVCYIRRRGNGYQRLADPQRPSSMYSWDCFSMTTFRYRQNSNSLLINAEENIQPTFGEEHLNFEVTLNVICSSKDAKWLNREITNHLKIKKNIISSKITKPPYGDYTLIVVNGNNCFQDHTFINNVQMSLKGSDQSEIKLLIGIMPDSESLENKSSLTDFIKNKLKNRDFFFFNANNKTTCLSSLRSWLKLDFVPPDV